ncbi:hypothetical protein [Streptomyces caniscabiei]|nr:hypothetical protein [Streptomyces caniscabiei]
MVAFAAQRSTAPWTSPGSLLLIARAVGSLTRLGVGIVGRT